MGWTDDINEILCEPIRRCALIKTPVLELTHATRTRVMDELALRPVWEVTTAPIQAMPIDGETEYVAEVTFLTRGKTDVACICWTDAICGLATEFGIWDHEDDGCVVYRTYLYEAVPFGPHVTE